MTKVKILWLVGTIRFFYLGLFFFSGVLVFAQDKLVPVTYTHKSGAISSKGFVNARGEPDGYWQNFTEKGQLISEGRRDNEKLEGVWKFYDTQGHLKTTVSYRDGKKNGCETTFYTPDSSILLEIPYENGYKSGLAVSYYPNGNKKQETLYLNDKKNKRSFVYSQDMGRIITVLYYEADNLVRRLRVNRYNNKHQRQGLWLRFNAEKIVTLEGTFRRDLRHGYFRYYDDEGNFIKVERYIDGVLQMDDFSSAEVEVRRTFYPDKTLKSYTTYRQELADGTHKYYDTSGHMNKAYIYKKGLKIAEGGYIDSKGRKQGYWTSYYPDGEKVRSQGYYKDGKKNRFWSYFYYSGSVEQQGNYLVGGKDSVWTFYYPNGKKIMLEGYRNGEKSGVYQQFDAKNRSIIEGQYLANAKHSKWFYKLNDVKLVEYYRNAKKNGFTTLYTLSNSRLYYGKYQDGKPTGEHYYYYPIAKGVERIENYIDGVKQGAEKYFDRRNNLFLEIFYRNDEPISYSKIPLERVKSE